MICGKHDTDGNPISRFNKNLILDTHFYEVVPRGEMTVLAANTMKESIYAQCYVDGNECLLLKTLINHRNNGSALSVKY